MSTSLRRSSGPTATRNVIGWSLPITLPTAANPSNESPRETRSTVVVSTRIVSLRAPEPKMRASEAASLAGGATGCCGASSRTATSIASLGRTSELVADAEAQHLVLGDAGRVVDQLVVALERRVPGGLVGEPERRDAPRQGGVPRDARGHVDLGVVALVAHEGAEFLRRRGREQMEQVVRPFDVPAGDAAPHRRPVARVDGAGVLDADVRHHRAKTRRPRVVARLARRERHARGERARPEDAVGAGAASIPERAADLHARARPFEATGEGRVRKRRVLSLLATLPDPCRGREAVGTQPVHEIHPVAEPAPAGNGPRGPDADFTPRRRQHVVIEPRPRDAVEGRRLVRFVDDAHRDEHEPRAQGEPVLQAVVEERLLDLDLAGRPAGLDPRVLHLELGPKAEALVEAVGEVHHEAAQRRPTGGAGAGSVGILHFPVSPDCGALLGDQAARPRAHEATAQHPHEQAPYHGCSVSQVEIWYRQRDSRMYRSGFTWSSKRYCCPSCASCSRCWG